MIVLNLYQSSRLTVHRDNIKSVFEDKDDKTCLVSFYHPVELPNGPKDQVWVNNPIEDFGEAPSRVRTAYEARDS